MIISILLSLILHSWVLLGTHNGITYEVDPLTDQKTAFTKNTYLSGQYEGYSVVREWGISCSNMTIESRKIAFYNSDGKFIKSVNGDKITQKAQKGSFAFIALEKHWCNNGS
jgi:hypothetical protein